MDVAPPGRDVADRAAAATPADVARKAPRVQRVLQQELQSRILGSSAHVFVWKPAGITDYQSEVARLRAAKVSFRTTDIVSGPGGAQIILDDPSGNPVEHRTSEEATPPVPRAGGRCWWR